MRSKTPPKKQKTNLHKRLDKIEEYHGDMKKWRKNRYIDFLETEVKNGLKLTKQQTEEVKWLIQRINPKQLHHQLTCEQTIIILAVMVKELQLRGKQGSLKLFDYSICKEHQITYRACYRVLINLLDLYRKNTPINISFNKTKYSKWN